jgi:acetyl esterase/lipase
VKAALAAALAALLLAGCASTTHTGSVALPSQVPEPIASQLVAMGRVVDPARTAVLYAPLQQREPYPGVQVTRDVRYGADGARNLLNLFSPLAGGPRRPVLVFVHGGAFIRGDRRQGPDSPFYDNVAVWAARNGMVGVNITYRLAPQNTWPAAQEDIAAALSWVRENIAARGGDPNRIFLMGHSAGAAHVAQYVGHPRFHVEPGGGIAGAIFVSGLFDPASVAADPSVLAYFGSDAALQAQRSALPGMAAARLPMLLAYAELDPSQFHEESEQAHSALCQAGHCGSLLQLRGHSHMSELYSINTPDTALSESIRAFVFDRR